MASWMVWIIIAIVLFIVEIVTPGFVVACMGLGALGAALAAYLQLSLIYQLLFFALTATLAFFVIRPLYLNYLIKNDSQNRTNIDALIGKKAMVVETIEPLTNKGRVQVGGEDWKAVSVDETPILKGTIVKILGVDGVKLIVQSATDGKEGNPL